VIDSLAETCKLTGTEPRGYLADVIARIVNGHSVSRLDELLPRAYLTTQSLKRVAENTAYIRAIPWWCSTASPCSGGLRHYEEGPLWSGPGMVQRRRLRARRDLMREASFCSPLD
jgi:hypothetical protein